MVVDVVTGVDAVGVPHDADPKHHGQDESEAERAEADENSDEQGEWESDEHEPEAESIVTLEEVAESGDDAEGGGGPIFRFTIQGDIGGVTRVDHVSHLFSARTGAQRDIRLRPLLTGES